jgi:hypothetical protein
VEEVGGGEDFNTNVKYTGGKYFKETGTRH